MSLREILRLSSAVKDKQEQYQSVTTPRYLPCRCPSRFKLAASLWVIQPRLTFKELASVDLTRLELDGDDVSKGLLQKLRWHANSRHAC